MESSSEIIFSLDQCKYCGGINKDKKRKFGFYDTEDYLYKEEEDLQSDEDDFIDTGIPISGDIDVPESDDESEEDIAELELRIATRYNRKPEEESNRKSEEESSNDENSDFFKKEAYPYSNEIISSEDGESLMSLNRILMVGVFPEFSGEEFDNFMVLAEKLYTCYTFAHTLDAKNLPHCEAVDKPTLRLFQPLEERFIESQDFQVDTMERFIDESAPPSLTVWDADLKNEPYMNKFFDRSKARAMLFVSFSKEHELFQPKYEQIATSHKGKGYSFLLGDTDIIHDCPRFGFKEEQAPVLIIKDADGKKYLKEKIEPSQIEAWMNDYMDGKIKPFIRSEPIPEINNEPVKVVVRDSLLDEVFNSGKNVLLEFYAPWCGCCQQLAPVLEDVAISFGNDPDVIIAKFDASVNDVPRETFDIQRFPTVYLKPASGNLLRYGGDGTKEDIIGFIQRNKDKPAQLISGKTAESESVNIESVKD